MEITFHGANCLRIISRQAAITVDDNLADLGAKPVAKSGDIMLYTGAHGQPPENTRLVIDQPGEYEVADFSIIGVATNAYLEDGSSVTIYSISDGGVSVAVIGHASSKLGNGQQESLGAIDVLAMPVGNGGFTLDAAGALELIKKLEPKIVLPTHYSDAQLKYPVHQAALPDALKDMAMEPARSVSRLKIKPGALPLTMELVVLERI